MYDVIEKQYNTEKVVKIEDMIYEINGVEVMLDSDLAVLYEVETKRVNEAVKNNPEKFPERFSWQLSNEEWQNLRSKISTSSLNNNYGGRRYNPRVFTEHGIYMLSTVLKSKIATNASIRIMDTFVAMRKFINENKDIYKSLNIMNNRLLEHDEKLNYLFSKFDRKEKVYFQCQPYSAYVDILEIMESAKDEIIIIDNYADINALDLIRHIECNVILITKNSERLSDIEISKYNREYHNLMVIRDNSFHDRYVIVDRKQIYLLGSSINSIGDKTFMVIKLEDKIIKETLLKNIGIIIDNK